MFPLILSLITTIFWLLSKPDFATITNNPLLSLSQLFSLIGTILLSYTFILSSRFNFLEKIFGSLDTIYKKHHLSGALAFLLLISHPILLALNAFQSSSSAKVYLLPSTNLIYSTGVLALYSLIISLTFTLLVKLPYHLWFKTHQLMGIVLPLALIHTLFINSDISRSPLLKIWIIAWILIASIAYLYKRFFYANHGPKVLYQVDNLENINGLLDLSLSPINNSLKYYPGQFIFISFEQNGITTEFHPFTIASSPNSKNLRLCLKVVSNYTASLIDLKRGTKATILGPYGHLYKAFETNKNLILIAGGIGITPFMSMIETEIVNQKNRQLNLFYSTKSIDSAFNNFRFTSLSTQNNNFKYYPVFTDKNPRLSAKYIQKRCSNFLSSNIIICGPQIMIADLKNQLTYLNVKSQNIFIEDFSLN